jgi:hypothetical protein
MSLKNRLKRKHGAARHETKPEDWPIGKGAQIVVDLSGGRRAFPYDDCPICRALREAGEEVITLSMDPFAN